MKESEARTLLNALQSARLRCEECAGTTVVDREVVCRYMPKEMIPLVWNDIRKYYADAYLAARQAVEDAGIEPDR